MKKRFCLCLLIILLSCSAFAHDFIVDGICYNIISEEYKLCEVTYFKKESCEPLENYYKDVIFIPETVDFKGVKYVVAEIDNLAFFSQDELLSVVMPKTIRRIGSGAFSSCKKLKSLTIPSGVTDIEFSAFQSLGSLTYFAVDSDNEVYDSRNGCNAIIETGSNTLLFACKSTKIPDGVEMIASYAFWAIPIRADLDISLVIPASVKVIQDNAFLNSEWLSAVTLHEGIQEIGRFAFSGTSIESVVIPESVTKIGFQAFYDIEQLTSIKVKEGNRVYDSRKGCNAIIESCTDRLVQACSTTTIPDNIKIIGENSFHKVNVGSVVIPASVVEIEKSAFFSSGLKGYLFVPGNVKKIGEYAFSVCTGIYELVLEEGVESIGNSAFSLCDNLRSVELPSTLKCFGGGPDRVLVFRGCELLDEIKLSEQNPFYYSCGNAIVEKNTLTVVAGTGLGLCRLDVGLQEYSPKKIAKGAFWGMSKMTAVWLPETIEEIEEGAFHDCSAIEYIYSRSKVPPLLGNNFGMIVSSRWILPLKERVVLVVPYSSVEAYRNAPGWSEFKHIVSDRAETECTRIGLKTL